LLKALHFYNRVNIPVIVPTPKTAGKVPQPNESMVKALWLTLPDVVANANAA
jgi:hypothetical protein